MIRLQIPLIVEVSETEYNNEYGSDDSREDIIDDIEQRVVEAVNAHFSPFSFVKTVEISEDQ